MSNNPTAPLPAIVKMPARGESGAPTFDAAKPRELPRFFKALERLFTLHGITSDTDKKELVVQYVDLDTELTWQTFKEFKDATATYQQFKGTILTHYPEAATDKRYTMRDLDLLHVDYQQIGINTPKILSDYHLQFTIISSWLMDKNIIALQEQRRAYIRPFDSELRMSIEDRLEWKLPAHPEGYPYPVKDVYDAAQHILSRATEATRNRYLINDKPVISASSATTKPVADDPPIKKEDYGSFFAELAKTMIQVMDQSNRNRNTVSTPNRSINCLMCDGPHYVRDCEVVDEYIAAGKARRNHEGKIVLSTGAYVPKEITGKCLMHRIDEWHRRNPGQLAAATLIHTIDKSLLYPPEPTYQLSSSDRVAHLEAELFALKARKTKFVPLARTRNQRRNAQVEDSDDEEQAPEEEPEKEESPKGMAQPQAKEKSKVTFEDPKGTAFVPDPNLTIPNQATSEPEHPFRRAKDAAYAPPTDRTIGAPIPPIAKKTDPAYRTLPPIYKASIASDVYTRALDVQIPITQRELLSLSPEIRTHMREATTTKRVPVIPTDTSKDESQNFLRVEEEEENEADELPFPTFAISNMQHRTPPEGSFIIPDPIESYVRSLPPGQEPDPERLISAGESAAVRSVFALVDNNRKKECILDSGCQVITISKAVSHELGIAYDPGFRIRMQSANGEYDMSLGLARNIPFKIGPVTIYVQAHVIDSNAYDVLLGRPFDVLTESVIKNFSNEDQTITIHDPNTGLHVTVPTLARGTHKADKATMQGFHL
jgi:hypothetical protein